jgi:hypothetical protein
MEPRTLSLYNYLANASMLDYPGLSIPPCGYEHAGHVRFDEQFASHFARDLCLGTHQAGPVIGISNIFLTHKLNGRELSGGLRPAQDSFGT